MRYEARLIGVPLDRPAVCCSVHITTVRDWAKLMLEKYPKGKVEIWDMAPKLLETYVLTPIP